MMENARGAEAAVTKRKIEANQMQPAGKHARTSVSSQRSAAVQAAEVIDFDRYVPTVVSRFMSKLKISSNAFFASRYGLTLLEWRIISYLAAEGASSAYEIWTNGSLDKAAVSRAIKALNERGLISVDVVKAAKRRKTRIDLTGQGHELHAATFAEVVTRHERLVNGLAKDEIETFLGVIKHLEGRIALMDSAPIEISSGFSAIKPASARDSED
jgi:DNA-binding MarR family transcriptional regulator